MPPASSILSPLAEPFVPTRLGYQDYASFAAIYNDGIPQGVVVGNHADHDIIHNISDAAIDEIFPPTAYDAAELDAADDFLTAMVDLSFLEEREEKTRSNYGHHLTKRWEARRQAGLSGRPYKIKAGIHPTKHDVKGPSEAKLVHFDRHHRAHVNVEHFENRRRLAGASRHGRNHQFQGKKANSMVHGFVKPIHQPRKMN
eukprot:CAMPEP_0197246642 /NCGR_PEP_ID=MMETSP1429-20130617/18444_1 /TAXON_ID=49237 /ORGANISM="Chaetoceros  sp., Strain UNC1202" /LENGTH=199 /DNA_ID=CAMNT_0042707357 /DNA_START=115 /DNA_END=714 /DNA_ORIENTATION=+